MPIKSLNSVNWGSTLIKSALFIYLLDENHSIEFNVILCPLKHEKEILGNHFHMLAVIYQN